jgi:hypothetical protein
MNPPGHTCPAIDAAQSAFRRLAWRVNHPDHVGVTASEVVSEGLALLEQVRAENVQLRQACAYRDLVIRNLEVEVKHLEQYGNDLRTIYADATASAEHWMKVAGVRR